MAGDQTPVVVIGGVSAPSDIPALCDRVRTTLRQTDASRVVCDVGPIRDPDCLTVDALARVRLTARRLGSDVELRNVSPELHELLDLAGLCQVVNCGMHDSATVAWGDTNSE